MNADQKKEDYSDKFCCGEIGDTFERTNLQKEFAPEEYAGHASKKQ